MPSGVPVRSEINLRQILPHTLAVAVLSGFSLAGPARAADPVPAIAPAPSWIDPVQVPPPNPQFKDRPSQMLILATQEKFRADGVDTYLEMVAVPQTAAGLQSAGTVMLPWNVERTNLTLHRVAISRGDRIIDLLKPADLLVLRRENNLEKATLDGVRTVVLPVRGLQIGDRLIVAVSYGTKPSSVAARPEDIQSMAVPEMFNRAERRILVPDGLAMRVRHSAGVPDPTSRKIPGFTEYRIAGAGTKEREWPTGTSARYTARELQFSSWNSWSDVASRMVPLFASARTVPSGSPVAAEADKIAAASTDNGVRLLSALRLVQEQVRYVALLLGEGAYRPADAADTWDRRFGDCKGKTALLLALLDRLNIRAEPMLVSASNRHLLEDRLPSLASFDHVIVRAHLGDQTYYLDSTDFGQRTLDELSRTGLAFGLPLEPGSSLVKLPLLAPSAPLYQTAIDWDGRQGFDRKVPFAVTLTLRGEAAAHMRGKRALAGGNDEFVTKLKDLVPSIGNDVLTLVSDEPEQADGSYVARFKGAVAMDWSPVDGLKGHRFELGQSTVKWSTDLGRTEGDTKDVPLTLNWPFYQQTTETILLPEKGKGFRLDAPAIDEQFAGVRVTRTVDLAGDRVIARSEFRHVAPEVTAEQVRSGLAVRNRVNSRLAYVVAPGRIRPVPDDTQK